jgi:N-acetylglucosamine kinase-like BadF-type ATPase
VGEHLWGLCQDPALAPTCETLARDAIRVSNDALAVLAAGGLGSGIVAIAGTGSLVWGRNAVGETARAGGWGYLLGDQGSGYDLGRRALMTVLAAHDSQEPLSVLATHVLRRLDLRAPPDLVERIYASPSARTDVAALAPVILQLMEGGDATAQRLVRRSARDLADQVRVVAAHLRFGATTVDVVCSGGLFANDRFLDAVQGALLDAGTLTCLRPNRSPAEGAALLAWNAASLAERRPDGA